MAEFQEVIKQMKRMCANYRPTCNGCPLCLEKGTNEFCGEQPLDIRSDPALVEAAVMSWAAEHPEPVYPMWCEWLADKGVVDVARIPVDYSGGIVTKIKPSGKMYEHIPADIAQKLGIGPVPVVHSDCGTTNEADARKKLGIEQKEG